MYSVRICKNLYLVNFDKISQDSTYCKLLDLRLMVLLFPIDTHAFSFQDHPLIHLIYLVVILGQVRFQPISRRVVFPAWHVRSERWAWWSLGCRTLDALGTGMVDMTAETFRGSVHSPSITADQLPSVIEFGPSFWVTTTVTNQGFIIFAENLIAEA